MLNLQEFQKMKTDQAEVFVIFWFIKKHGANYILLVKNSSLIV